MIVRLLTLLLLVAFVGIAHGDKSTADLDPSEFDKQVIHDGRVWLVEFYSAMCGSCQEFAPTWNKISSKAKTVVKGQINIDNPKGMALAEKIGALEQGIPNVRVFSTTGDSKGISIVNGETATSYDFVARAVKSRLEGLRKGEDGYLAKR